MANICENQLYVFTEDESNVEYITKFIYDNFRGDMYDKDPDGGYYYEFDSKWIFPEEAMKELYDNMPNKDSLYMRCLSVEYGNYYHSLWICKKEEYDGWIEV